MAGQHHQIHDRERNIILKSLRVEGLLFAGVNVDQCLLCTLQDANFRSDDILRRLRCGDAQQHQARLWIQD